MKPVFYDKESYVLIDLSSFIFHRYFAIKSWIKISGVDLPTNETEKKAFIMQKYRQGFIKHILNIQKKTRAPWEQIYLIKDCPRDTIWRRSKCAYYKMNREEKTNDDFDPMVFHVAFDEIIPTLYEKYKFKLLGYKEAEADDIIAIIKNKLRAEIADSKIFIISNDNDFIQLYDDKTFILSNSMKPLKDKFSEEVLSVFLRWKIIKGDISDNIPPIESRLGDKMALKLALNAELLQARLSKNVDTHNQFELNSILIDFAHIPIAIKEGVLKSI